MPIDNYREYLLQKANDAAQRSNRSAEPVIKAAWQRIEANYRMTAASVETDNPLIPKDRPGAPQLSRD